MNIKSANKKVSDPDPQLGLDVKVKPDGSIGQIRRRMDKRLITVTAIPYWKSFSFVLSFVFSWMTFLFLSLNLYLKYDKLPDTVPILYSQALNGWEVFSKNSLVLVFGIFFIFNLILPWICSNIYNFDKRLVLIMNISTIIVDILLTVAFYELFSLLTV